MDQPFSKGMQIARAEEASRLLHGPVFADAYARARQLFIQEWEEADSTQRRELCWAKVAGLTEVQRQLRRIISAGEHASRTDAR
jgi:hypothetical protein